MDTGALKDDILRGFEYAHLLDDWVNPVEDALSGVTARDALWRPGPDSMGIWDIVLHMAVWTENAIERIRTGKHTHPAEGPWPPIPERADHAAWENAKQRLRTALNDLRTLIEEFPPEALVARSIVSWSPLLEIIGRYIHNSYHLGQITKLREIQEAGPAAQA